jgi:hypothetical protein
MKSFKIYKLIIIVLSIFIFLIFASFLAWYFQKKIPFNIYVLDKTVPDQRYSEHKSFNWILNYYRFTNKNGKSYNYKQDYYGYLPYFAANGKVDYNIRSLRLSEILSVPDDMDMVYYADTYGISAENLYNRPSELLRKSSVNYGGLNQNDYLLLSEMKRKNKLIIAEFNMLGAPTSDLVRSKTESLLNFSLTGWKGCSVESLNRLNLDLPTNIVVTYEKRYSQKWNFDGPGIILFQENGEIIVLDQSMLTKQYIQIITSAYGQSTYHLPHVQNYSYWFEIIKTDTTNKVVSTYQIPLNNKGENIFKMHGLCSSFPAVIEHLDEYKFYYFAGDFSDRNISMVGSCCKGFSYLAKVFYPENSASKNAFFWMYYKPLIYNIINNNLKKYN